MGEGLPGARPLRSRGVPARRISRPIVLGALHSPHELRVESRDAIGPPGRLPGGGAGRGVPAIARHGARRIETGTRPHRRRHRCGADHIVIACPGTATSTRAVRGRCDRRARAMTLCKLHMLRLAALRASRLPAPVMSDLGMLRYLGYAGCRHAAGAAGAARRPSRPACTRRRHPSDRRAGRRRHAWWWATATITTTAPDPFQPEAVSTARILAEFSAVLDHSAPRTCGRALGRRLSVRPRGRPSWRRRLPGVRLAMVTSGTGASTAFALAEETLADLLGLAAAAPCLRTRGSSRVTDTQ